MHQLKTISTKIILLGLDLLMVLLNVLQQIKFPRKGKRSNLFSSALLLYSDTILRLDEFEHGRFRMLRLFRQRWVRFGLFFLASLLLALSSFEGPSISRASLVGDNQTEQACPILAPLEAEGACAYQPIPPAQNVPDTLTRRYCPSRTSGPPTHRYLWVGCLRL